MNLFPLALRTALQMLCIVGMVALASQARAESVTWDYTLYPPLEAVMTGGDDSRIYTENRAPQYVLTRFVVNGASATAWQEAFEVLNTMRRDEPRKPKQWLERLRKERDAACPGEWHIIAEDDRSLTFERRTPDCPPHAAQTALYRVIYGPQQVFTLIATVKVDIPAESRTAWLEVLASADVRP